MSGYIDMHCHILPEVDDGAESMKRLFRCFKLRIRKEIHCYYSHTASSSKAGKRKSEST